MIFVGDCTHLRGRDIQEMVDSSIEITYRTFIKHVGIDLLKTIYPFSTYDWGSGKSDYLRLKNDYMVSYHRGKYKGKLCYYIYHSAIEYIFQKKKITDGKIKRNKT